MSFEAFFQKHGVAIVEFALGDDDLTRIENAFAGASSDDSETTGSNTRAGQALPADFVDWLETHPALIEIATRMLAAPASLVQIKTFDKTPSANWFVPWHQDRAIAVANRHRLNGFKNWVARDGHWTVEPPVWVLQQTVALRIHLDATDETNGPLEVLANTHSQGRLKRNEIAAEALSTTPMTCLCSRGDILVISPLAVHRSQRAKSPSARRVLHLDFSAAALPAPLNWAPLQPERAPLPEDAELHPLVRRLAPPRGA
ncbi:MAG: phytanoyl-CoA dioxygenase family protein [Pseudomonadota bacterium]